MKRNIFLFWEGKDYKLITILRDLIYYHSTNGSGYQVHFINYSNLKSYVEELPDYFYNMQLAHQADYIRVYVIHKYGGIWLDSDTLVCESLDNLFDLIESKEGFFMTQNDEILSNGVFGSKSGTQLMNVWKTILTKRLDVTKGVIGWSEIGNNLLQFLYINHKNLYENYTIYNGLETMYPVNWNRCVHEFLLKPYDNYKYITRSFQPIIILVNSVYKHYESMDNTDCTPLMYFIQKSLQSRELYIYLKIAKNMGTTFDNSLKKVTNHYTNTLFREDWKQSLLENHIISIAHQSNIREFKCRYKLFWEHAKKLIILREPMERLISSYTYVKHIHGNVKPLIYYLTNIPKLKDKKHNYDSIYVHLQTTQLEAMDYDSSYHNDTFIWMRQKGGSSNINLTLFDKKVTLGNLNKTKLKKHILSSEETMIGKELFQKDIDVFYENPTEKSLLSNLNNCLKTVLLEKNYKPVLLGNLCYDHEQYDPPFYDSPLLKDCEEKRNRIMKASKSSNCVFEIGLNGGHSSLLMLESNPKLKIVANDIAEFYPPCPNIHPEVYVPAAAEFLTNNFKDRFTFIKGSCLKKVPEYVSTHKTTFDMVHIDGAKETYQQDFYNLAPSLSQHAFVVFDDTNIPHVQNMVNNLLKEGFVSRTEEFPQMNTSIKYRNEILRFEKNKYVFSQIYKNCIWNNKNPNIPLSGPGSSMEQTKKCRNMLESFVDNYGIMTITDLGCGDLTWMSQCNFFSKINYIGIDAATQIISQHKEKYDKTFLCEDITSYQIQQTDLIILRDVVFHLSIEEVQNIFRNIKDKFKFIAVTSCNNAENTNIFDQWKFSERNLHIDPFCVKGFPLYSVNEDDFNRKFYIYDHDSFYGCS